MGLAQLLHSDVIHSDIRNLRDVLLEELKDIYSAEKQLLKVIPEMERKAATPALKISFANHFDETKAHVFRLERISEILKEKLAGKTCRAMQGLISEGDEVLHESAGGPGDLLIDTLLIGAAQRVEHYEIAAYDIACAIAARLGEQEVLVLLQQTLAEEQAASRELRSICEDRILPAAYERSK